jgi:serine-type D-Ala-D-Ala carboxypeptidase (penicillin-binding protein 5/6)
MRKIIATTTSLAKTNRGKVLIAAIAIIFVVAGIGLSQQTNGNKRNYKTGGDDISARDLKKLIATNKEKYYPKTDWLQRNPQSLAVSSKGAVILDYETKQVLLDNNMHEKLPPASITKVLTAVVALENYKLDKLCTVSQAAADTEPYKIIMEPGEKLSVEDLMYGMMMLSANDAAEVLAECDPGGKPAFMAKMNQKVKELGLTDSNFVTPNGLDDPNHYSTAFDMATITEYAIRTQPDYLKYMGRVEDYSVGATDHNGPHYFYQLSTLIKTFPGMEGAKTGFTYEAGNTYIGVAKRDGRRIIIVYFNANSKTYDATTMLEQGFFLNPSS